MTLKEIVDHSEIKKRLREIRLKDNTFQALLVRTTKMFSSNYLYTKVRLRPLEAFFPRRADAQLCLPGQSWAFFVFAAIISVFLWPLELAALFVVSFIGRMPSASQREKTACAA